MLLADDDADDGPDDESGEVVDAVAEVGDDGEADDGEDGEGDGETSGLDDRCCWPALAVGPRRILAKHAAAAV